MGSNPEFNPSESNNIDPAFLQQENEGLKNEVSRLTRELKISNDLALIDPLTELDNRRGWDYKIVELSENILRDEGTKDKYFTIMFFDLNNLKQINNVSHEKGDDCLCNMADLLRETFTRKIDKIARWGGDEFGAITVSNEPLQKIVIDRLNKLAEEEVFKDLRYCAGVIDFKVEDFLKEIGGVVDKKDKIEMIKQGLLDKINEADILLNKAKEMALLNIREEIKPSVIVSIPKENGETTDAFQ